MKTLYILLLIISPIFGFAQQLQMRIVGATVKITDSIKVEVEGNFRLFGNGQIDNDGLVEIEGYFINSGTTDGFINRNSIGEVLLYNTVSPTIIAGSSPIYFETLTLDNPTNIDNQVDLFIDNQLEIINGKIETENNLITIFNTSNNALIGFDNAHYIIGKMRQYIDDNTTYTFPIGTSTHYEPATVKVNDAENNPFIEVEFITGDFSPITNLTLENTTISEFLDYGLWQFNPIINGNFDVELTSNGHTNGSGQAARHALFRQRNGIWENAGNHDNITQSGILTDAITAKRTNIQGLGNFIIGKGDYVINTTPNWSENFQFINAFTFNNSLSVDFIGTANTSYTVRLMDLNGRIISTQITKPNNTKNQVHFDTFNLPSSLYIIVISSEDFIYTRKIILK